MRPLVQSCRCPNLGNPELEVVGFHFLCSASVGNQPSDIDYLTSYQVIPHSGNRLSWSEQGAIGAGSGDKEFTHDLGANDSTGGLNQSVNNRNCPLLFY